MRFDHAVILVPDLDRAAADYRALGFTVSEGGEHRGGKTRNALIGFADGSYLELLAFTRSGIRRVLSLSRIAESFGWFTQRPTGLERRFRERAAEANGLIDFALRPTSMRAELARLPITGVEIEGPLSDSRIRPDGEEVRWEVAIPRAAEIPFLCCDEDGSARAPSGDAARHENGAEGVVSVRVAVANLEASSARYRAFLGVDPRGTVANLPAGTRARAFPLEGAEIVLVTPGRDGGAAGERLRRAGQGPFALQLRSSIERKARILDRARTHGPELEMVPG